MPSLLLLHRAAVTLSLKGMTIGTLRNRGILLVCNYRDLVERTVVLILAVMLTLIYRAFDAHVGLIILHDIDLPFLIKTICLIE